MGSETFLTGGAERTLSLAARLAGSQGVERVTPLHLLAALLMEEGVAAEYLARHGIGLSLLRDSGDEYWHPAWESPDSPPELPAHSDSLGDILIRARSRSHSGGRPTETDTLDLLVGLLQQQSPAAKFLSARGLSPEILLHNDASERTGSGLPLPMEENLRWETVVASERISALRIVDASINRLREGIRVVEEYFRFHRDDASRAEWIKRWRHRLTEACLGLNFSDLLAGRETQLDVGTSITLTSELSRDSLHDVLWANLKRAQESCRTLEEYGKLLSTHFAERIKQLRYDLYTFEKGLRNLIAGGDRWPSHPLYLLVTEDLCRRGSGPVIRGALQAGVRIIQIREKSMPDRKLVEHGRRIREWTREFGALLIMNDRPDLAVLIDADGVHVGQEELGVLDARRIVGPQRFVGVSTHSVEQAEQALRDGADYIGVGPVFPSKTKSFREFVGLDLVRNVCGAGALPSYAIGGIDAENLSEVIAAGARGVAVSSAVCGAEDPQSAARHLLEMFALSTDSTESP